MNSIDAEAPASFDMWEQIFTAEEEPAAPMVTVNVDGVPMIPAAMVMAALDRVAMWADENRRRRDDLVIAKSTRLVDVESDAMGLALDLIRGYLAEPDGHP